MKKFTLPCSFGNKKSPFDVYIGLPGNGWHPLYFQSRWLLENRSGTIAPEAMESFQKLKDLAEKNGVSFEDLCVYALEAANEEKKKTSQEVLKSGEAAIAVQNLRIENQIRVLATPDELQHAFNEHFTLLFVVCRDQSTSIRHAVIILRSDKAHVLSKLVEEEKISFEQLNQFGHLEYAGNGPQLEPHIIQRIMRKYQPQ